MPRSRGAFRDRHDRGFRRPLLSNLFRNGESRLASFEQIVAGTCEYLMAAWPEDLAELKWLVADAPSINDDAKQVRRWGVDRAKKTIIIYRLPIERLGHFRRPDALDERMHIEQKVFEAVGFLLERDPWDLMPDKFRPE